MSVESVRKSTVWWALRHPLKALAAGIVAAIGLAFMSDVDWQVDMFQVRNGLTAQSHQEAHGIE